MRRKFKGRVVIVGLLLGIIIGVFLAMISLESQQQRINRSTSFALLCSTGFKAHEAGPDREIVVAGRSLLLGFFATDAGQLDGSEYLSLS